MESELHLPWGNAALEELLTKIAQTGETTKIDFKRQLNIVNAEHHAELLKDISAMANTYDYSYRNHGFILLGVTGNNITFTTFGQDADALQARIDDIVKSNIDPFIPTQVRIFGQGVKTWGVIAIPPTRTAPHVFVRDICKRCRGDIYVRRGTTTEKALPGDYARFFRQHLDEYTHDLRQEIEDLKRDVISLRKTIKVTASKHKTQVPNAPVKRPELQPPEETPKGNETSSENIPQDLAKAIETALPLESDPISAGFVTEAKSIQKFLISDAIPWSLTQVDNQVAKWLLDEMEKAASGFWKGLGILAYRDEKGKYDDTIIRALTCLAQRAEPPVGFSFTDWGTNVRYLPLVVSLYVLFMVCGMKKRYNLLKRIAALRLLRRSHYEEPIQIPYVLFNIRVADGVFQALNPNYPSGRWCDAVSVIIDGVLQRTVRIDDPAWNDKVAFFVGEFLLCLTPLDVTDRETKARMIGYPAPGNYLYFSEADPIIRRFLSEDLGQAAQIFNRPFREILRGFDQTVGRVVSRSCSSHGFAGGAEAIVYPGVPSENA